MAEEKKTDAIVRETLDEHESCMKLVAEVEGCLDRPAEDVEAWVADLRQKLTRLQETLRRHFEGEEAGPLFRDLAVKHPRLSGPLAQLEAEHPVILEDIEAVLRKAGSMEDTAHFEIRELNARAQLVVARIQRHEAAENELVLEAHWSEIGVGD